MENISEIKIEKNIPLPRSGRGIRKGENHYPFADMEIGDCFFIELEERYLNRHVIVQSSISTVARMWKNFNNKLDWQFTTRRIENKIGVWRVK